MVSRFEQFVFSISSIYGYIQKIERDEMERYGLKGAYAQYLVVLCRYPQGMTAAQLCEICDRDKAAVSRALKEMETIGLIQRQGTNDNLYRASLKLTQEGGKAARFVCQRAKAAVEAAGKGLTVDDRKAFYATLELIASNLHIISKEGIPAAE